LLLFLSYSATFAHYSSLPVRAKFGVDENGHTSLVLEADGCVVDADDLPEVAAPQQPFMLQ
jgi:hypothetical protein